jgi:hypothetical protein
VELQLSRKIISNKSTNYSLGLNRICLKYIEMRKLLLLLVAGVSLVFFACEKEEDEDNVVGQSAITQTTHNTGNDCLSCHKFTVAGSVYNKSFASGYTGAIIKITSEPNGTGTLMGTFTSNKSGSFYTSGNINFGTGVYVSVTGSSGVVKSMATAVKTGACNSCHGSSSSKIWAE